jgi:hypothetical protein
MATVSWLNLYSIQFMARRSWEVLALIGWVLCTVKPCLLTNTTSYFADEKGSIPSLILDRRQKGNTADGDITP